ncbi:MAG: peptidoglycan DD-metalloendopeptidase family protein [Propionibacteriaceae bacterium]|jgi:murein DD-endopeptidase MepM/ murein hydrolase activator NlpD|nr:peptidoglycan DD-metalloendopeptidase family protein [Propionibacteriaceae bacterium]
MLRSWKRRTLASVGLLIAAWAVSVQALPVEADTPGAQAASGSIDDIRSQLADLEEQQQQLSADQASASERLAAANQQLQMAEEQMQTEQVRRDALRSDLAQIAVQQYQDHGLNTTAMLVTSSSSDELLSYFSAMQMVTDTTETVYQELVLSEATMADLQRSSQAAVATISAEQTKLDALAADLKTKVDKASTLLNRMTALAQASRATASVSNDQMARGVADPSAVVPSASESLIIPLSNYVVSSPFSMRVHPITGVYTFHDGIDLAAGCGTPVHSAANGFVIDYHWSGGYGNRLVIDNGIINGHHIVTSYSHLSAANASAGQSVAAGDSVASVGSTGQSTGCHLHFMVWSDGQTMDPAPYLFG